MAMESRKYQVARSLRRVDEALAIQRERLQEALKIFIPTEVQQPIADCKHRTLLLSGGNRCLGKNELIYDPVENTHRKVSEIDGSFHVLSLHKGKIVVRSACKPFLKGHGLLYRFQLSNGQSFVATMQHRVYCGDEQHGWLQCDQALLQQQLSDAFHLPSIEGTFLQALQQGAQRSTRTIQGSQSDCRSSRRLYGEQLRAAQDTGQGELPSLGGAALHTSHCSTGDLVRTGECIHCYQLSFRHSIQGACLRSLGHDDASESRFVWRPYSRPSVACLSGQQFAEGSCHPVHTTSSCLRLASRTQRSSSSQAYEERSERCFLHDQPYSQPHGPSFLCRTATQSNQSYLALAASCEPPLVSGAVKITSFHLIEKGEIWDFSVDETENYLHCGVFHHNSSKTTTAAYVIASWLLGKIEHPNLPKAPDVTDIEACKKFDGRAYLVGKDATHLGEVMYRKLFRHGAFKVIRDEQTGLMRAYLPWKDAHRSREAKPGPAFIPNRFIESQSYRLKKDNVPRMVRLKNGWEVMFFTGEGVPAQGFDVNLCWFDEEIEARDWVHEAKRGLVDRGGVFVWSATPQAATDQFLNLLDQAEVEGSTVAKFIMPSYSNPHISKEEIDAFSEGLTEDERKVRIQGEPATASFLMYPTFDMSYIGMSWDRFPKKEIPEDWTRYAAIDPGYGVTAVVFFAVPPPSSSYGDIVVAYDELYITKCTSEKFAEAMALKMGKFEFQAFLIDDKQAAKTETTGKTIKQQLAEALRERNVSSVCGGFIPGEVDNEAGCHAVRDALRPRSGLGPKYRIMEAACPNLERNFQKLRRKRIRGASGDWVYKDVPADNQDDHAFDCFRYMVCFDPRWVEPTPRTPPKPWALLRYELKQKKNGGNKRCVTLGPPQKRR